MNLKGKWNPLSLRPVSAGSKQKCAGGNYFCHGLVYRDEMIASHFLLVIQKEVLSSAKASHSAASQHRNLPSPFCPEVRFRPGLCFCCGSTLLVSAPVTAPRQTGVFFYSGTCPVMDNEDDSSPSAHWCIFLSDLLRQDNFWHCKSKNVEHLKNI